MRTLNIAIAGTRGIPARYGGFETAVEEISTRLARRGHRVCVYCRCDYPSGTPKQYKGVELIEIPQMRKSFLATPLNSFLLSSHFLFSDYDVIHFFGGGTIPFIVPVRLAGRKVLLTIDGLEWKRSSYSKSSRCYLRLFAEMGAVFPNVLVADSMSTVDWYSGRMGVAPEFIPYGASVRRFSDEGVLRKYNLLNRRYILFIGRLVSEKGVHTLVEAFKNIPGNLVLVVVGDFPGHSTYVMELKRMADDRTVFAGYVYGDELNALRSGATISVHPSLLEGTSISLLSALGSGKCIVASNLPENIGVTRDAAVYFRAGDVEDLSSKIRYLLENPSRIAEMEGKAALLAEQAYDWEKITDQYERLYLRMADGQRGER